MRKKEVISELVAKTKVSEEEIERYYDLFLKGQIESEKILNMISSKREHKIIWKTLNDTDASKGFVYFLKDKTTGLVKIGCSTKLSSRIMQLKGNNRLSGNEKDKNYEIIALVVSRCKKLKDTEKKYQQKFSDKRRFSEWFEITDKDIYERCNPMFMHENIIVMTEYEFDLENDYKLVSELTEDEYGMYFKFKFLSEINPLYGALNLEMCNKIESKVIDASNIIEYMMTSNDKYDEDYVKEELAKVI